MVLVKTWVSISEVISGPGYSGRFIRSAVAVYTVGALNDVPLCTSLSITTKNMPPTEANTQQLYGCVVPFSFRSRNKTMKKKASETGLTHVVWLGFAGSWQAKEKKLDG